MKFATIAENYFLQQTESKNFAGCENICLKQLCPTHGSPESFVWSSLGFRCSKIILHTDNLSLFW